MNNQNLIVLEQKTSSYWSIIKPKLKLVVIHFAFILLLFLLMTNQEISFQIHIGTPTAVTYSVPQEEGRVMNASFIEASEK